MKLFNRWETETIQVHDLGIKDYINIRPLMIPRTSGRNVKTQFWKSKNHIVERLMNKLMVSGHKGRKHRLSSGHNTGKSIKVYKTVYKAFDIIEKKLGKNPVEVFIKSLENAAPREEITTIEYGGARYPQSVECSPQRRIDIALRQMVQGSYHASFRSKRTIPETLADEIMKAYVNDNKSQAIAKKAELERQAEASR
nr:30S ribosomal protein S7 [Candidatus Woesearchaeota archaeon]